MFRHLSLRAQLISVLLLLSILSLLVVGVILLVEDTSNAETDLSQELTSLAQFVGDRSSAALVFADDRMANENLNAFNYLEHIGSACLFNEKGDLFAGYLRAGEESLSCKLLLPLEQKIALTESGKVKVQIPVMVAGNVVGVVQINSSANLLFDHLVKQFLTLALALGAALVVALFVSLHLQYIILQPLAKVREVANNIVKNNNFSLRAPDLGKHELGELANAFNRMLQTIETQNKDLAENEAYTRKLFYDSPISQVIADPVTRVYIDCNLAAARIHGFDSRVELIGKTSLDVVAPVQYSGGDAAIMIAEASSKLVSNEVSQFELLYRRPDASLWDGLVNIMKLHLKGRDLLHISTLDISERKKAIQEITTYRDNLESLVKERTRELLLARDTAESSNRAKSVFLSNMSHELRTPLNAILGFVQILERDGGQSIENRKKLATINRAGKHLLALINDVLEISRIEAGRSTAQIKPFDLKKLLREVEEIIRLSADKKCLEFKVISAADLPRDVTGDENHLKQVLINLLGNAVKYTDNGSVSLRVNGHDEYISFEVSDTGPGISIDDQGHLFDAFFQTETGIAKGEGTGLGLAISQKYTLLMGGELSVSSQPGSGSTFTLKLPLPGSSLQIISEPTGEIIGLQGMQKNQRVLVVDDKPYNVELLSSIMESTGFEVRGAADGQQAVDIFQSWQPCFIWMDMRMPVLDGYLATKKIRSLPAGDQVKIVALTASAFAEDRPKILAAGCDDAVSKPFHLEQIYRVMAEKLGLGYLYAGPDGMAVSARSELDFSLLPEALLQALGSAADALDLNSARDIVRRIAELSPAIATHLEMLIQGYRFDQIAELCKLNLKKG